MPVHCILYASLIFFSFRLCVCVCACLLVCVCIFHFLWAMLPDNKSDWLIDWLIYDSFIQCHYSIWLNTNQWQRTNTWYWCQPVSQIEEKFSAKLYRKTHEAFHYFMVWSQINTMFSFPQCILFYSMSKPTSRSSISHSWICVRGRVGWS